jgi:hypothetical protein
VAEVSAEMTKPLVTSLRGFSPYVQRTREYMLINHTTCYTVPMIMPLTYAVDIWKRHGIDFSAFRNEWSPFQILFRAPRRPARRMRRPW